MSDETKKPAAESEGIDDDYGLAEQGKSKEIPAPGLDYLPRDPKSYRPKIGLIGCGGITVQHLKAYKAARYDISFLCSRTRASAEARRQQFYPDAKITTDFRDVLADDSIEVVDIATHPGVRAPMIEAALEAGKHVLSQKPYVVDLDFGERMADLAEAKGVKLAVNLNGRWAPHFSAIRAALAEGLIGQAYSIHMDVHWNHNWIAETPFNEIPHLVLYDFAIHWFDLAASFFEGREAKRVFATTAASPSQEAKPPLLARALIDFEDGQASLVFAGDTRHGQEDRTFIVGSAGSIKSVGPSLEDQSVTLHTAAGHATLELEGSWFTNGFHGTMAELLCAIEEDRNPANSARSCLPGLAICFAAVASAERGEAVAPGSVRRLPGA